MKQTRDPGLTLKLTWHPSVKRWRLDWWLPAPGGRGFISHWRWIDVTHPVGAAEAQGIADSVVRELQSQLPFEDLA